MNPAGAVLIHFHLLTNGSHPVDHPTCPPRLVSNRNMFGFSLVSLVGWNNPCLSLATFLHVSSGSSRAWTTQNGTLTFKLQQSSRIRMVCKAYDKKATMQLTFAWMGQNDPCHTHQREHLQVHSCRRNNPEYPDNRYTPPLRIYRHR
jgi:hypothetical protein